MAMETEIPVRDIMTRPVITADASLDVLNAAKKMGLANVGSLIVVSGSKPIGILTERDLVKKVISKATDPRTVSVGDVMSAPLVFIAPEASLREAAA
jgi:CBS domain-containing protein